MGYRIGTIDSFVGLCISADKQSIMQAGFGTMGGEEFWMAEKGPYIKMLGAIEFWQVTYVLNGGSWNTVPPSQVPKDGKIWASPPKRTGYDFAGWYLDAALTVSVTLPYDVSSVTGNITLYAKWDEAAPSATALSVTVSGGAGFYTSLSLQRQVGEGWTSAGNIPTTNGTHNISVEPGTYRIFVTYWSCTSPECMNSLWSSNFTVSEGQTKSVYIVGVSVTFP